MTETWVKIDLQLGPKGQLLHMFKYVSTIPMAVLKIDFGSHGQVWYSTFVKNLKLGYSDHDSIPPRRSGSYPKP